jgi:hypothetical protein
MGEILKFEADRRAINITINSLDTELTKEGRSELYCNFGELFGEGIMRLERAENHDAVRAAVEPYPQYRQLFQEATYSQEKSLEDCFFEYEVGADFLVQILCNFAHVYLRVRASCVHGLVGYGPTMCVCVCVCVDCISFASRTSSGNFVNLKILWA